ncbi:MAG TPA: cell division protein FtsQ/DivIB [Alphaproteobacteria bacterium]|nr:cell division protein FtsQ/DivIB [Alphaproteobacteria bacterium]
MRRAVAAPLPTAKPRWRRLHPRALRYAGRGAALIALLALIGGGAWLWKSGAVLDAYRTSVTATLDASARLGLKVEDVTVEGRYETPEPALLAALGVKRGTPLLGVDLDAACARLEALPWVRTASIERRWPHLLFVHIDERVPLALWQSGGKIVLIDTSGTAIPGADVRRYAKLPMVVGPGANKAAPALLAMLAEVPSLARRVDAAVWVSNRRWNLHFQDGIDVRLPETAPEAALARLVEYEAKDRLLERDIVMIDMRLPDRLIVRLAPGAATAASKPGKST